MKKYVLFIHGAGKGAYEEDGLLVASLQNTLGSAYDVRYPQMVNEDDPEYADWKVQIASELAALDGEVILVGHSVGGSVLLKYLSEERVEKPVAGLFLLATPYWGADEFWSWDEARLPEDVAAKLTNIPRIFLYHSRDDEIVPFAHLALLAARLPQATIREVDGRGHQLGNDLSDVAEDIMRTEMNRPYGLDDEMISGGKTDMVQQSHTESVGGRVQYLNPDTLNQNPAFTNVIVVTGPVKTVYVGGQDSVDASGAIIGRGDLAAQTEQVLHNLQAALAAAGARPEHVVKWNVYVVQGQSLQTGFEVFQRVWGHSAHPPAISGMFVAGLAHPDFLVEMDAIAVVPE